LLTENEKTPRNTGMASTVFREEAKSFSWGRGACAELAAIREVTV